jgi:hypothetical protein
MKAASDAWSTDEARQVEDEAEGVEAASIGAAGLNNQQRQCLWSLNAKSCETGEMSDLNYGFFRNLLRCYYLFIHSECVKQHNGS